ncbi:MAG TPA: amidase family protein [Spongiibacteraceae bacterium]|nr:amidase family protein [Spongiibacteraceae bacterium]
MSLSRRTLLKTTSLLAAGVAAGSAFGSTSGKSRGLSPTDYASADAVGLAEMIRSKQISASDALEAAIARAEQVNPKINAVVLKYYDMARTAARNAGSEQAPLNGVPMLLKDLSLLMKGTTTTNGSRFFKDAGADHDSTFVQRYRAAGLNIFGKTASPEFGGTATTESILWGQTRNPWNTKYSSGGSSGGAAAAVAAGIIPAAHASDGGGSIRIPASHCGLFGLKPSRGRTPTGPDALEGWMGLSVGHAITRSVRDSALLLDIAAGAENGSRVIPTAPPSYLAALATPPQPLRIALLEANVFGVPVHAECKAALMRAAKLCEQLGHHIEPATLTLPVAPMMEGMGIITGTGMLTVIRDRERALGRAVTAADLEPITWASYQNAQKYSAEQLYRARATADQVGRIFDEMLTRFDMILSPVTALPPPLLGALSLDQPYENFVKNAIPASCFTSMYNIAGLPAMSVPLYWSADNLPIGSMFAGRFGDEVTLLQLAAQLEQAAPWRDRRPTL